jgi:hypothetical protein
MGRARAILSMGAHVRGIGLAQPFFHAVYVLVIPSAEHTPQVHRVEP